MPHVPQLHVESFAGPLRVVRAPQADSESKNVLSPAMTLGEYYRASFRPAKVARGSAKRNLDQYDQSINLWCRLTGDPPLEAIDDAVVDQFSAHLWTLPGRAKGSNISANTIRKHDTHLQAVLDRTGPPGSDRRTRRAHGLLAIVPYLEKPKAVLRQTHDVYTVEEISRLLECAGAPIAPRYLAAELRKTWWQSLILATYNTGLRIGSVMALRWANVLTEADGLTWLRVGVKGGDQPLIYCNTAGRQAIEQVRPIGQRLGLERVFHFPHDHTWLQAQRRLILDATGFAAHRRLGFHALRKAMVTETSRNDPLAAQLQAGHKDQRTTNTHYIHPARVVAGLDRLPQPR